MKTIIEQILELTDVDEARTIKKEAVRHFRRIGSGCDFDMEKFLVTELSRGVLYLEELTVERRNEVKESVLADMAKVISKDLDGVADRADYVGASIKAEMEIPSELWLGFSLHFSKNKIQEQIDRLTKPEGFFPVKKGALPFNKALGDYCDLHDVDLFAFCKKVREILADGETGDAEDERRAANHYALLDIQGIDYILKNEDRYKELFKQEFFFKDDPILHVKVGETELTYTLNDKVEAILVV